MRAYLFSFCHIILHILNFLLILYINYTKYFLQVFLTLIHYLIISLKVFLESKLFLIQISHLGLSIIHIVV